MLTLLLLIAMALFMVWACAHTRRRRDWWQDERDAEEFVAELRSWPPVREFRTERTQAAVDAAIALDRAQRPIRWTVRAQMIAVVAATLVVSFVFAAAAWMLFPTGGVQ